MHKMNGQSFIAQKIGLNPRKGVKHYSAPESNIYWVRGIGQGRDWPRPDWHFAKSPPCVGTEAERETDLAALCGLAKLIKDAFCAAATLLP